MNVNTVREKHRVNILLMVSIAFAVFFLASFVSQTVQLARLQAWREELEQELHSLDLQRAELDAQIALRQTDAWIGQAAVESGLLPPNAYAVQVVEEGAQAPAVSEPSPSESAAEQPITAVEGGGTLWDNDNWRAWQRLLLGRP